MKWCQDIRRIEKEPSIAEKRIINFLNDKCVQYYREVKFEGLVSKKGFSLYFDFYIPFKNLIIEYDGIHHEDDQGTMENDIIKNLFCENNGIKIVRLNKLDWNSIEKLLNKIIGKLSSERISNNKKMPTKWKGDKKDKAHNIKFKKILRAYHK